MFRIFTFNLKVRTKENFIIIFFFIYTTVLQIKHNKVKKKRERELEELLKFEVRIL